MWWGLGKITKIFNKHKLTKNNKVEFIFLVNIIMSKRTQNIN